VKYPKRPDPMILPLPQKPDCPDCSGPRWLNILLIALIAFALALGVVAIVGLSIGWLPL
jgi:hypothetical protein